MVASPSTLDNDLNYILEALADLFPKDELRPGVTLSLIESGQTYASIVRWPRRDIKHVAISLKAPSTKTAVNKLRSELVRFVADGRHLIPYVPTPAIAQNAVGIKPVGRRDDVSEAM